MAFGIARKQTARFRKRFLVMQAGENIEHFALLFRGVADSVSGNERQLQRAGQFDSRLITCFFFAIKMALEFNINIAGAERAR